MSPPGRDADELERLRDAVAARAGLQIEEGRLPQLAELAAERVQARRLPSVSAWAALLLGPEGRDELRLVAERLTVGETYFFRNANDLRAFVGAVLPARAAARATERRLRILSAGCSTGEEPYTLAMLVQGVPELASWDVAVRGIDLNPAALARGRSARYGAWSLRQTPDDLRKRFFRPAGRELQVAPEVRRLVAFEERNLVDDDPLFWARGAFDVVFCRNVLMYLAPAVVRRVVARIAGALQPGGFLFLGHAETLRGVSGAFHLRHEHGTFFYQLREGADPASPPVQGWAAPDLGEGAAGAADAGIEAAADEGDAGAPRAGWADAIRAASERIARLVAGPPRPARAAPPPHPGGASHGAGGAPGAAGAPGSSRGDPQRIARAIDLLSRERFRDALGALGAEREGGEDPDALVLRAVLLVHSGDLAGAERLCERILRRDELSAEAHYVKALCREHAGDRAGAEAHDRYALYLDPGFAMPRLHLGLMARRAGDADTACRELSRAVVRLAAEDASRILLLGGGFSRDALLDLCRSELRACGGDA